MYEKNKYWMHQTNQEYILNRIKKLPKVQLAYHQKWEEIEKSTGAAVTTPMMTTPMTPTTAFPLLKKEITQEETSENVEDKQTSPSSPPTQQSRMERFMKRHLYKQEDPSRHNIRLAKLKVEVGEAGKGRKKMLDSFIHILFLKDINYRNVVREISTLAIKMDATNQHIMKQVHNALKEKSKRIKVLLETALKEDIDQLRKVQKVNTKYLC